VGEDTADLEERRRGEDVRGEQESGGGGIEGEEEERLDQYTHVQ
jgi:hypothetical protein